jgi:alanyl-tRNA synthetase
MGLERTLAVLNGVPSVYETSCFLPTVSRLIDDAGLTAERVASDARLLRTIRILADHLRAAVFILGDQRAVSPSNQGQGYVLRRLIRRGIRYCNTIDLAPERWIATGETVLTTYQNVYPDVASGGIRILQELEHEHDRFRAALNRGTRVLEDEIAAVVAAGSSTISGETAFRLFDTFGFPIEFTTELAAERGLKVEIDSYHDMLAQHREKSRSIAAKSGLGDDSQESVRYHTATHLLHAALRHVLGEHVQQRGSNITRERLRFDFIHPKPMSDDEIAATEAFVQSAIDRALPVSSVTMPFELAKTSGAIGLFEDRYSHDVSVYTIGDVSKEICAGPHVGNTRELGRFKITKEQSSSAGVRRIRAVLT